MRSRPAVFWARSTLLVSILASIAYAIYFVLTAFMLKTRYRTNHKAIWYNPTKVTETWYYDLINDPTTPTIWPGIVPTRVAVPLVCIVITLIISLDLITYSIIGRHRLAAFVLSTIAWLIQMAATVVHLVWLPWYHLNEHNQSTIVIIEILFMCFAKIIIPVLIAVGWRRDESDYKADRKTRQHDELNILMSGLCSIDSLPWIDIIFSGIMASILALKSYQLSDTFFSGLYGALSCTPPFLLNLYACALLFTGIQNRSTDIILEYLLWNMLCIIGAIWALIRNDIMNNTYNTWATFVLIVSSVALIIKIVFTLIVAYTVYIIDMSPMVAPSETNGHLKNDSDLIQATPGPSTQLAENSM